MVAGALSRFNLDREKTVRFAVEHCDNLVRCALQDGSSVEGFGAVRFEDFLVDPELTLAEIDGVVHMGLTPELLSGPHDDLSLGSTPDGKWHLRRPGVNEKHVHGLTANVIEAVYERCADLGERFGYTPDGP